MHVATCCTLAKKFCHLACCRGDHMELTMKARFDRLQTLEIRTFQMFHFNELSPVQCISMLHSDIFLEQVWRCGGRIEIVPCSRVGHLFRDPSHRQTFKTGCDGCVWRNMGQERTGYAQIYHWATAFTCWRFSQIQVQNEVELPQHTIKIEDVESSNNKCIVENHVLEWKTK